MQTTQRIWRTADGELVLESDDRAAFLAYGVGDDVAPAHQEAVEDLLTAPKPRATKATSKPADKAVTKPGDK